MSSNLSVNNVCNAPLGEGGSTTVSRGEDEAVKQVTFNGTVSKTR